MDSHRSYYSHEHTLFHHYVENGSTKERCDVCNREIYGMVYACEICKFTRHGSCAQERMPSMITHPSHSVHQLQLRDTSSDFLCERCFYNSRGPSYSCDDCEIDVDLACASSTTVQPSQGDQGLMPEVRVRKRTRHFSHGESLALFKYRKTSQQFELDCSWCGKRLSGMSYGCFKGYPRGCKFFLHESCISKIPKRLLHPFHPLHYLYVQYFQRGQRLSCNACKRSFKHSNMATHYACHDCSFYLHISCARLQPTLKHKCHQHYLTYFSRSTDPTARSVNCRVCGHDCNAKNNKEGVFYRCVQCDFNIHFRCLPAPPIAKHRYHSHFLILHRGIIEDDSEEYYCDICEEERHPKHHIYYCKKCKFIAHVKCVLKKVSDSQVRRMTHLVKRVEESNGEFPKLKETGDKNQLFKMQEIQFLLKDLEQEKKEKRMEKQKYFEEDEDAERYTSSDDGDDVDEGDKVDEEKEEESSDEGEQENEEKEEESSDEGEQENESENEEKEEKFEAYQGEASTSITATKDLSRHPLEPSVNPAPEIHHFSHTHPLKIFRLTEKYKDGNCNACKEELFDTVYICEYCKSYSRPHYGLHKACTELPYELQHPIHSQHSLILLNKFPFSPTEWFQCDACRVFSNGFVYLCTDCLFKLDVKCAVLAAQEIRSQHPKHREKETRLLHFSHEHMLVLGTLVHEPIFCLGCDLPILGPACCCFDCFYTIHESCLRILPQEMRHPFHPLHPLVAFSNYFAENKCHACKLSFILLFPLLLQKSKSYYWRRHFLRYGCLQCKLDLHFVCANSLRRVLKSNSHTHNLYYFGPDSRMFLELFGQSSSSHDQFNFMCRRCSEMCEGPFYRCLECAINFHLKCIPVPQRIKSKCHLHHLTLKDSFVEDNTGEYYCDACEEERQSKDHIYYCEECHFVAHIECVLSMVEETSPENNSNLQVGVRLDEAWLHGGEKHFLLKDLEQVEYFDEDEKNDDDDDNEEGSEADETSTEIATMSNLESEFQNISTQTES